ncbi:hypothetical protein L218DRAFT_1078997 [Marasmius fiardii PR-910]|nr:hypothetical protein L218DRAFT_1078997 [Marasmius fiardii PR-910]
MNDSFENVNNRQDAPSQPFPIISAQNMGEGAPLNFGFPSGINQGSPFNPNQFSQFTSPNYMYPGWMVQHPGMHMIPPRPTAGTTNMDVDGIDPSDDGDWVSHPEHRIVDHIHCNNQKCNDLLGHIIMAKRRGDPRLKAALKDIEDDIVQPYKESAQRAKAKVSSLEAKLDSVKAEYETRLTNMDNNFNSKYNTLQQRYQDALDDKAKLFVENTSLRESMDRTRRDYSPSSFRGHGRGISHRRDGRITPYTRISSGGGYSTPKTLFTHSHERIPFNTHLINWGCFNMPFPN